MAEITDMGNPDSALWVTMMWMKDYFAKRAQQQKLTSLSPINSFRVQEALVGMVTAWGPRQLA